MLNRVIFSGTPELKVTLPMPPSHRERPRSKEAKEDLKRRKKKFLDACERKLSRFDAKGKRYLLYADFAADWLTASGEEKRRDIPNLLVLLSDGVAKGLQIDDKRFRRGWWGDIQIDGCSKEEEFVVVKVYLLPSAHAQQR